MSLEDTQRRTLEFERSEGFIDEIMEGIPDPASDPLLALSRGSPKAPAVRNLNMAAPLRTKVTPLLEEDEEQSYRDKELSFYALNDVESLDDVIRTQRVRDPTDFAVLRIMHCGALTSMKGIGLFQSLRELNLSSNSLMSMQPLFEMGPLRLEILNLSCNKLT